MMPQRTVNLIPKSQQIRSEHWRQAKRWSAVWILSASLIAIGYVAVQYQQQSLLSRIKTLEVITAPVRRAEDDVRRLTQIRDSQRRSVETAQALEQSDVALAILQVVGNCCSAIGDGVQIDSLRIDEVQQTKSPTGQVTIPKKQLLLVGSAEKDHFVTTLVSKLVESSAFSKVELESSQAVADQQASRRTFQVRCQQ
jgi:Fimbrial assembly protein (PilN)